MTVAAATPTEPRIIARGETKRFDPFASSNTDIDNEIIGEKLVEMYQKVQARANIYTGICFIYNLCTHTTGRLLLAREMVVRWKGGLINP